MPLGADVRRGRVLVVDDDRAILELITTRLDLAGFQVAYARNGREALSRLRTSRPDGLVLDINMPVMDGFAVLTHLRSVGGYYPRTLVLTARNRPEDVKAAIALGARDFLAKPFDNEQLIARVGRLMRKAPVASVPTPSPAEEAGGGQGPSLRPVLAPSDAAASGPSPTGRPSREI